MGSSQPLTSEPQFCDPQIQHPESCDLRPPKPVGRSLSGHGEAFGKSGPPSTESRLLAPESPQMVSRPSAAPLLPALWSPLWPLHSWHSRLVPCPQEAFWCLVQICELYLPGYYGPHMVRGWAGIKGMGEGLGTERGRAWVWEWRC